MGSRSSRQRLQDRCELPCYVDLGIGALVVALGSLADLLHEDAKGSGDAGEGPAPDSVLPYGCASPTEHERIRRGPGRLAFTDAGLLQSIQVELRPERIEETTSRLWLKVAVYPLRRAFRELKKAAPECGCGSDRVLRVAMPADCGRSIEASRTDLTQPESTKSLRPLGSTPSRR